LLSCEIVALSELGKLNVEHVVKLHDIAFQEGFCYLVMELLEGGSLAEYIKENPNGLNDR
jgi:serine/threonine protein kinase